MDLRDMVIYTLRLKNGSLRFGYINFETEEAARTAIESQWHVAEWKENVCSVVICFI